MKENLDDILLAAGCVCIVIGVGLVSIPAALIVAGLALIGFGFLVGKKMANDGFAQKLDE